MNNRNKIVLLGLNEINFEYIKAYTEKGLLPNFKILLSKYKLVTTTSENEYELLEPWIQWVTVHTGKTYEEHKIFRLGDIVLQPQLEQLWEIAEKNGLSVGAISPFNAANKVNDAKFFVPDPWTQTPSSGTSLLKSLSKAVSQSVNDNAQNKLQLSSALAILRALAVYVPIKEKITYVKLLMDLKSHVGTKAVILDKLLGDTFLHNWNKYKPDFSSLFLNTGAHFQHHYMFNSDVYPGPQKNPEWYCPESQDPLLKILSIYDKLLGDLLALNVRLMIATGLHQKPYNKLTYYWRLKDHGEFLKLFKIPFKTVVPRMSRDFLIEFDNLQDAALGKKIMESIVAAEKNEPIFNIDDRGLSLFIELIYPNDIQQNFKLISNESSFILGDFKKYVAFVAIKNGEHDGEGYFVDTDNQTNEGTIPLKDVFSIIKNAFVGVK